MTTAPTRIVLVTAAALALASAPGGTATPPPAVNDNDVVTLPGNVHPLARPENDVGPADPSLAMERMILALKLQPGAQAALERLLAGQQDPGSPDYHRWLTPDEFGARFGPTPAQLATLTGWLTSHGFVIDEVAKGGLSVNVTATVADVERAFHTHIRQYRVGGELHHANATDPQIPRALAPLVAGPVSLNDFRRQGMIRVIGAVAPNPVGPEFTSGSSHYLAPADFATIYDVNPLYSAGIDGTGQTIAIVGRTDIALADVQYFRSRFGLPANDPQFVHNGADPGDLGGGEETEGDLDVEWSGAVAPMATVKFVISKSTASTDGVDLSAQYIVTNSVAPMMSTSFGLCEAGLGSSGNTFYGNLWSQAAAQGITSLVSAGDSGAAGCDSPSSSTATGGAAVSGLSSTPYNVCVGGSEFLDASNPGAYWSSSNNATTQGSVLSYIPEEAWNESGSVAGGSQLWATGGGASSIYAKPSWQVAPGVPSDNARDVPDVSLSAAGHDGYLIVQGHTTRTLGLYSVGGTSASSPSLAGILSLVVQKTGASLGNANVRLYQLGNAQYGSSGAAVFHDVTTGSNSVPGVTGFACGTGYDLATGLGSVDAAALVNAWSAACTGPGAFALVSPTSGQSLAPATQATLQWSASAGASSYDVYFGAGSTSPLYQAGVTGTSLVVPVTAGLAYTWHVVAHVSCSAALAATAGPWQFAVELSLSGTGFYPVVPCRVVDTRVRTDPAVVKRGTFAANETRAYTLSGSTDCPGLPADAVAWSLNIQYRPLTHEAFLTAYPDGVSRPVVSTLVGYPSRWRVNNSVVPAGSGGTFDVYCQYAGNVVIDVNGYFR